MRVARTPLPPAAPLRRLPDLVPEGVALNYIGRPTRASTGEGYSGAHAREQERIVLTALTPGA